MAQLFANNAAGVLASPIVAADTALTLQTGQGALFPSPAAGVDFFLATLFVLTAGVETAREIVKVSARSGDGFTIARAQEGSTAQDWAAGSKIELRTTAQTLDRLKADTFRNRIINGAMQIDQRNAGAAQTFTAGAALAYCVDRFYGWCSGANLSGQQIAMANGQNRYRFTGAASNTGVGFAQRIEAKNSLDLAGKTATLQARLSSSSLTTITWAAYYATTTDSFGTLAAPTRTQIATGSFTINSTEALYSAAIALPAAAITGLEIVFTGGALLGSQTLTLGDVQLEEGGVVTPFERRPMGMELALCQRFFWRGGGVQNINFTGGSLTISSQTYFGQLLRALPTITVENGTIHHVLQHGIVTYSASAISSGGSYTPGTITASAEL